MGLLCSQDGNCWWPGTLVPGHLLPPPWPVLVQVVLVASRKLASTGILRAANVNGCLSGWCLKVWLSSILLTWELLLSWMYGLIPLSITDWNCNQTGGDKAILYVYVVLHCIHSVFFYAYHVSCLKIFIFLIKFDLNFPTLCDAWLCWVPVAAPVTICPWQCWGLSCLWLDGIHQSLSCWSSCMSLDFWWHSDCLWLHLSPSQLNCLVVKLNVSLIK